MRDISAPSAVFPTPFYLGCLDTLAKIGSCELISKRIYASLLSLSSSPPVLPRQWSMFIGSGFSLDDHWSLVRDSFTENFKNDLLWLITLRAVKVRDSLKNWGYIASCVCAFCSRRETIDHCFLNCSRVKRVWAHFVPILTLVLGTQFVSNLLFVFFFLWPSVSSKRARIARFIVKSILYGIWTFRNKTTFHNGNEDHRAIIRYIILYYIIYYIIYYITNDIQQRIILDHIRLSEDRFLRYWAVPSFCAIEDGVLQFDI